jgi:hypothetical protein
MTEDLAPDFLIIGAARSGTTLLAKRLNGHPDVWFTEPKETHFLALAGTPARFTGPGDTETINRVAITDEDRWYSLLDGGAGFLARGEGSVSTLYYGERAINNIRRYCPDARLIVLLREPVDRAYSAYMYQVSRGYETETFERALVLEASRIHAGWHHIWHYAAMGEYARQLAPFVTAFGRDRLLVLGYEDLVADPVAGLRRCFEHIDVPPFAIEGLGPPVNAGGEPRSVLVQRAMTGLRSIEPLRKMVTSLVPSSARERVRSATLKSSTMGHDERSRLTEHYALEKQALADLLGDDAPSWA